MNVRKVDPAESAAHSSAISSISFSKKNLTGRKKAKQVRKKGKSKVSSKSVSHNSSIHAIAPSNDPRALKQQQQFECYNSLSRKRNPVVKQFHHVKSASGAWEQAVDMWIKKQNEFLHNHKAVKSTKPRTKFLNKISKKQVEVTSLAKLRAESNDSGRNFFNFPSNAYGTEA